ncbi:glycoside hydrolase family 3 protein [Xylariales sp. PMI_506]|nr:glycoside hydrolase family 3 protein [Xylariales sp. PMI_506]
MRSLNLLSVLLALAGYASGLALNRTTVSPTNTTALGPTNTTNHSWTSESVLAPLLAEGYLDLGIASEAYEKAKAFVAKLDFNQKIRIITNERINSSDITWKGLIPGDGIDGVNNVLGVSGYTNPSALAMSWNKTLFYEQYKAMAKEFYDLGVNLVNGPVLGPLGRNPYNGRYPETISPEPYLTGIVEAIAVTGYTASGVVTSGRHFLLYEQETNRTGAGYSSNADDKTVNELYLWPFADAVRAGMMACMCAMNAANGTDSCGNSKLLNGYLKTSIGFPGLVQPDTFSQYSAWKSADSGLDFGSSIFWNITTLGDAIKEGFFTEARLTDMATRIVLGYYYAGLDDGLQPKLREGEVDVRGNHSIIIGQAAREAIVLLKNDKTENGLGLPLKNPPRIALFGAHAGPAMSGPNEPFSVIGAPFDMYPGHLAATTGSGEDSFPILTDPYSAISQRVRGYGGSLSWVMNNTYIWPYGTGLPTGNISYVPGSRYGLGGFASFRGKARKSDACLCFVNSWSGEGGDRKSLAFPVQTEMIRVVADNCNNTIVVANVAGPEVLDGWITHTNVTAVLYSGYLGQDSGNAIADVLFGDVNPSGKLPYTIAKREIDYPVKVCETKECFFTEGVYIDYRYFDARGMDVRYPFGYGLSYTTFSHTGINVTVTNQTAVSTTYPTGNLTLGGKKDLFDDVIKVTSTVTNTGSLAGAEVSQLYISFPEAAKQPPRLLRGFAKTNLEPKQSAIVEFNVRRRDISHWDIVAQEWAIVQGQYTFSVGSSSRDLAVNHTITL